jgi:Icc-related predicted phosphoesterase
VEGRDLKIVHLSDWHGVFVVPQLPEADVYVVTGDMLPNDETLVLQSHEGRTITTNDHAAINWFIDVEGWHRIGSIIERKHEVEFQSQWIKDHPFRKNVGIPDHARVVVVRGNHDYIDLEPWIGGNCFEVKDAGYETISFDDVSFGGIRGVCLINGRYADELDEASFYDRVQTIHSDVNVLVTHSPPKGILATAKSGEDYGSQALRRYVDARAFASRPLKAHLFGHVHMPKQEKLGDTLFSNAATSVQEIEL